MNNLLIPLVTNVLEKSTFLETLAENFILHFSVLIVGLFLVRLIRVSLFNFLGLYLILGGLSVGVLILGEQSQYWIPSAIAIGVSLVLTALLAGMAGENVSQHNYQAILVGLGLFPWYLGWGAIIPFGILAFFIIVFWAHFKIGYAFRKIEVKRFNIKHAKEKLTEEQYEIFRKAGSITFSMPLLIAVLGTLLIIS